MDAINFEDKIRNIRHNPKFPQCPEKAKIALTLRFDFRTLKTYDDIEGWTFLSVELSYVPEFIKDYVSILESVAWEIGGTSAIIGLLRTMEYHHYSIEESA